MSYSQYGKIEAVDFNNLVGGSTDTNANRLNTVWGRGTGSKGYGQPFVINVGVGDSVSAANWASLINTTSSIKNHQGPGTSITSVSSPVTGDKINYVAAVSSNVTAIYPNSLNAVSQGSSTNNTTTYATSWRLSITFTHTITFGVNGSIAAADAARYFFNAGGQIKIQCAHGATGTAIDTMFNKLASGLGTIVLSAASTTIAGTTYTGTTQVGGDPLKATSTIGTGVGYYTLTTTNQQIASVTSAASPTGYGSSNITMSVKSNGAQGVNGDAGTVITVTTVWTEVLPNEPAGWANIGLATNAGSSSTTVTAVEPSTSYLTKSWSTPALAGSVTGS